MRTHTVLAAVGAIALAGTAIGQTVFGLTTAGDRLVSFAPSDVSTLTSNVAISGLQSGETLRNIDFRPRTGELFALSSQNRMYVVNTSTGAATQRLVGTPTAFTLNGTSGMDFNPVPDRIRVTTSSVQNLRLNPDTGGLAADDGIAQLPNPALRFVAGDPNFGATPNVVSVAYTNSTFGTPAPTSTTMFAVHRQSQFVTNLVRQGSMGGTPDSPNNGNLTTIGAITGIFTDDLYGFDIFSGFGGNDAYFSGNVISGGTAFYSLDLATGSNTFLGNIGGASPVLIRDFSLIPAPGAGALLALGGVLAARRRR
jgi:hypothetical protein